MKRIFYLKKHVRIYKIFKELKEDSLTVLLIKN
jgi:hypothetical protein